MRQVVRDRANDGGGPMIYGLRTTFCRHRLQDWSCRARRFCCPRKRWCGRRDLNPHGPFKPCGFSCRLRLSPPGRGFWRAHARFAVWTIPSPSSGTSGA